MLRRRVAEVHNAQKELEFEKKLKEEKKKILRMKGTELEVAVSRAFGFDAFRENRSAVLRCRCV